MKNRLEELRKQRGIRQEELAAALEVSRQTIGSLENGRYNPSILLAFKIARYFGMSIEEIFIYEEEEAARNRNCTYLLLGSLLGFWYCPWRFMAVFMRGRQTVCSGASPVRLLARA